MGRGLRCGGEGTRRLLRRRGHSLVDLRVRAELGAALGIELPFELFFTGTTIAAQAVAVRAALAGRTVRDEHPLEAVAASTTPLSPNQRAV